VETSTTQQKEGKGRLADIKKGKEVRGVDLERREKRRKPLACANGTTSSKPAREREEKRTNSKPKLKKGSQKGKKAKN